MDVMERVQFFKEMIQSCDAVPLYVLNTKGEQVGGDPDVDRRLIWFRGSGCLARVVESKADSAVCVGGDFGTIWGAVKRTLSSEELLFVIGPVLLADPEIAPEAKGMPSTVEAELPVIPFNRLQNYLRMLYFCVHGRAIVFEDISFSERLDAFRPDDPAKPSRDRRDTYLAEQRLLYHVREGNLAYGAARRQAAGISGGVRVRASKPVYQGIISAITFTSLCTRAAIEGGLTPETAYSLGDYYIQSITACRTVAAVGTISRAMYEDFVMRVHEEKKRTRPAVSGVVRRCMEYVEFHPERAHTLAELARRAGYSEYYFSRKFKAEAGFSLPAYIEQVRMERAKLLLETEDTSVAEIARRLHFCTPSHFGGRFREYTGMLPSEYRAARRTYF